MKRYILISLAAIILSFTSCVKPEEGGKDNPPAPQEQIIIPSTVDVTPVVPPEGGDTKFTFTAASAWTASVISTKADFWVDVNPKSGDPGTAEITITTTPNETYVERNATIQIKCGTHTKEVVLTQKQQDNITVTTDKVELGAEGGTFTIELKSNIDFSYEIDGDWIKYVSTKAYSDKTLTFSVEPNEGVQKREGSVTVKGREFTETVKIYQEGNDMVDLGLSVKWATCNLGASKPEEYGGYYQWAGLKDFTSASISLDWNNCPYHTGSSLYYGWTRYVPSDKSSYWSGNGSPDNRTILEPEDDVAHVTLGDNWRMPTKEEWKELINNCTWSWTNDYNGTGVAGNIGTSNIPGYTNKSIFLPAAGGHHLIYYELGVPSECYFRNIGSTGYYWTSSLGDFPDGAFMPYFSSGFWYDGQNFRVDGNTVRPVYVENEKVRVMGVIVDPTRFSLNIGDAYSLSATIIPSNAQEKGLNWSSSDPSVATVDQNGKVIGVKVGSSIITVKTTDGGYTATCSVTVSSPTPAGAVNLGLSVKWATCNIGATKPEEYGDYYAWGETETYYEAGYAQENPQTHWKSRYAADGYAWSNYKWCNGSSEKLTKYNTISNYGMVDNNTVLDSDDDIAHIKRGGKWRIPTNDEWIELKENCIWLWSNNYNNSGVSGIIVTSRKPGYTDKSIFLPAAGTRPGCNLISFNGHGVYLSSSIRTDQPFWVNTLYFYSDNMYTGHNSDRCTGLSVRPVTD